ncbi:FKBP-type peptidyl-prolyl cis-trans isomerase [Hymenobacter sp. BT491]|uniref:FKBP-type peptidyl-prolyl cis-trans isomerase n=1 Tax=Hymenobacter sp. BT491 TaxID=2766779 RepID=UPI001653D10F|nr:FKBP-type peptidyl-prolyl cis-trans isomerase [Hymenobacter sp. BT491]MBC6992465.1 FKBP-type peptidyl-prolyl cis-trans isomerase [Hymenobacter sp. BT491]
MMPSLFRPALLIRLAVLLLLSTPLLTSCLSTNDDLQKAYDEAQKHAEAQKPIDEATIQKYLADSIKTFTRQTSGLYFVPRLAGTGTTARAGQTVSVLYTGSLLNGQVFDASSKHGNVPISFVLGTGQVIPGWDEGIALMSKGSKATLLIPSGLAYGAQGNGPIPADAVLRFQVELVDIK